MPAFQLCGPRQQLATVLGSEYIFRRLHAVTVLAARGGGDDDML